MPAAAVDVGRVIQRMRLAVNTDADITGGTNLFPELFITFANANRQRRHQIGLGPCRETHDLVDHFIGRLRAHRDFAGGTIGRAQPGQQDPQVVVDLGDRADGGTGRVPHLFLFDGDRGRKAVNVVQLRFLHLGHKLPRIAAQTFHIAALPFGIDRVHGQRRLATATHPTTDRHLVAGDLHVDALQVVLPSALDADSRGELFCSPRWPGFAVDPAAFGGFA